MFHPLWPDVGGGEVPSKDLVETKRCSCGHGFVIHTKGGGCNSKDCLCGWVRDMSGALYEKASGRYCGEVGTRPRYRGAAVGSGRRARILKEPCYFCGEKAQTIDHFCPRSKGGKNDDLNLVPACHLCNGMKSDKLYDELIVYCQVLLVSETRKTAMRSVILFQKYKSQAVKILARHERRLKELAPMV